MSDVSPYVREAAKRANGEYPWMAQACYEPKPLPRSYGKSRSARRFWLVFGLLAVLSVICGALVALNP